MNKNRISNVLVVMLLLLTVGIIGSSHFEKKRIMAEESQSISIEDRKVEKDSKIIIDATTDDYPTVADLPFSSMDSEGELDGFERMNANNPLSIKTVLTDEREYSVLFGALDVSREVDDEEYHPGVQNSSGQYGDFGYDNAYQPLPNDSDLTSEATQQNENTSKEKALNLNRGVPILGANINVKTSEAWVSNVFAAGSGNGGIFSGGALVKNSEDYLASVLPEERRASLPVVVKMYTNGERLIAYGVDRGNNLELNNQGNRILGYYKVEVTPVGNQGRINIKTTYLNASSQKIKAGYAYGLHVDIDNKHIDTQVYDSGDNQGFYFYEESIQDGKPYFLEFHRTGYEEAPINQVVKPLLALAYDTTIWSKSTVSGEVNNWNDNSTESPGKNEVYPVKHPLVGMHWAEKDVGVGEKASWQLEESVTSSRSPWTAPIVYGDDMEPAPDLEDEFVDFRVDLEVPLRDVSTGFPQKFVLQNNFPVDALKLNTKEPVKITNENGIDVSNKFATILNEGKLETSVSNPAAAGSDIYGHTLSIKYQFVAKSDIDLMPYLKDGFYRFNLDATFLYSETEEPLQSNVGEGTLPGPVSTATAYYRDEDGNEIQGFPPIIQEGKVAMDTFEFKQLEIDNYEFVNSEGPLSGLFEVNALETIFTYKANKLDLTQTVEHLNGEEGTEATIGEVLQYGLKLKTPFSSETPEVFYKTFTFTEVLDPKLEEPTETVLKKNDGSSVGKVEYNAATHTLVATISEEEQVLRSEDLKLEYKAKVKNNTTIGTEINAKATVEGSYSNGSQAKSQESNEVTTTITDGILEFISAPNKLSFGDDLKLAPTNKLYPLKDFDSSLTVKDNRVSGEWSMVARVLKPMTGQSGRVLNGSLRYYKDSIDNEMTEESLSVYTTHSQASEVLVSDSWKERIEGPMLNVRSGQATNETYTGTIEWELQDVPGNDKFLGDL